MTILKAKEHKLQRGLTHNAEARHTHRFGVKLWRVVVDVSDGDEGRGRVRQAEVEVALHVCGLHDQCVLRHFLQNDKKKK